MSMAAQPTDKMLSLIDGYIRAGFAAAPDIGLFTGSPSLSRSTVLADLTALAPTYTGYATQTLTLGAVRRNAAGDFIEGYDSVTFQPSGWAGGSEVVTGYFVQATITLVDWLMYAEFLDSSFTFTDDTSALTLVIEEMTKNLRIYGGYCSAC